MLTRMQHFCVRMGDLSDTVRLTPGNVTKKSFVLVHLIFMNNSHLHQLMWLLAIDGDGDTYEKYANSDANGDTDDIDRTNARARPGDRRSGSGWRA